jgi:outer membrane protein
MNTKCFKFVLAAVFAFPAGALAQTANADPLPAAPSATNTTEAQPAAPGGNKIATINVEQAIFACNEGQRDFEVLSKKLEPKQTELKNMNDEVENLKKQLNTSGDKLSEDARNNLVKQIEQKQKNLERTVQDARDDAQSQQNEIAQRILQKMAPVIVKFAGDKGFGVIVDTSNPWPQGPLWISTTFNPACRHRPGPRPRSRPSRELPPPNPRRHPPNLRERARRRLPTSPNNYDTCGWQKVPKRPQSPCGLFFFAIRTRTSSSRCL